MQLNKRALSLIVVMLLTILMVTNPIHPVRAAGTVKITGISTTKTGNIFTTGETVSIPLVFTNTDSASYTFNTTYSVKDSKGNSSNIGSFSKTVAANGNATQSLTLVVALKGTYTLEVTAVSTSPSLTVTKSIPFSIITPISGSVGDGIFGVGNHFAQGKGDIEKNLTIAQRAGVQWIRDEMYWGQSELTPGVYTFPAQWDNYVNAAIAKGMKVLVVLDYGNSLYMADGNDTPHTPAQVTAFANYAAAVANHFAGRVNNFEIWNEWNGGLGNANRYSADVYANLLKAAHDAIKSVNSNATIIGCATSTVDGGFINNTLAAGGYNYMEGVSIHPYTPPASGEVGNPGWYNIASAMDTVNNLFIPRGGAKPVWFTEMGWSTSTAANIDESHQAAYISRMFASGMASGVSKIFSYDLQDDGTDLNDNEQNWGLIRNWDNVEVPWSAKQSYVAYNALTSLIKNATYVSSTDTDRVRMIKFNRASDNKDIVMLFNLDDTNVPIAIKGAAATMQAYDMFGNAQSMPASLSYEPIYLIGTQGRFNPSDIATSSTVIIGDQNIESSPNGLNSGRLNSFKYTLSESSIIQSLSINVKTAAGTVRMGIYADNAGVPGALKASTPQFTPVTGWNTSSVTTPVVLPAGSYWLAFQPSSDSFQSAYNGSSGTLRYADRAYSALPSAFPSSTAATGSTSLYATFYSPHIINNAVYTIEPLSSPGKILDASGTVNGSNVAIWTSHAYWESGDNQKWKAVYAGNGYWKFVPLSAPNFALDVSGAGTVDGTNVQIWTDDGVDAKLWKISSADLISYQLEPKVAPGKLLDVAASGTADGTNVQIYTANGSNAQKWKFNLYSNPQSQALINNAIYTIEPLSSPGKILDANGSVNGSNVSLWSANTSPVAGNNQKWKAVNDGGGYWKFFPLSAPAYSLDVAGAGSADGTNVQIWFDDASDARKWKIGSPKAGYYQLEPKVAPGKALDVNASGTTDGTNVQIYTSNGTSAQKWRFNLYASFSN